MFKKVLYLIVISISIVSLFSCASASKHRQLVQDDKGDRLTVGTVQRKISIGMPSADVIQVLGAPNIVTTDEERREVWVYDKIATNVSYSNSESGAGLGLIIFGVGGSGSSGAQSTSQKTLTVVIKFDKDGKVRDFAYHTSSF